MKPITLCRPIGLKEFELVKASGFSAFPPRLSWQPIFYPVLDYDYACSIARDWNTNDEANGNIGFVTAFDIPGELFQKYDVQNVGDRNHNELWVPAEELEAFNKLIISGIQVLAVFYGINYNGPTYQF